MYIFFLTCKCKYIIIIYLFIYIHVYIYIYIYIYIIFFFLGGQYCNLFVHFYISIENPDLILLSGIALISSYSPTNFPYFSNFLNVQISFCFILLFFGMKSMFIS